MTVQPIKKEMTGVLFDIQRFSVNDGPGIRTNLFFKGCPLRCIWCHNPESYIGGKQMSFVSSVCTSCMACVKACKKGVNRIVEREGNRVLLVDYNVCDACGECLKVCCYDARSIIGKEYTVKELADQVKIDLEYYKIKNSAGETGGITLTGGEPMSQFPFIDRFLEDMKGIHVCMETCGYAPQEHYEKLLEKVDLFLFDFKAADPRRHKELCGVGNRLILSNLEFLCSRNADLILRLPLIAGLNDDDEHLRTAARLIKEHPNIRRGEIMAYHNLGISKAEQIGIPDIIWKQENTSREQKERWLERFREFGVENIRIG